MFTSYIQPNGEKRCFVQVVLITIIAVVGENMELQLTHEKGLRPLGDNSFPQAVFMNIIRNLFPLC